MSRASPTDSLIYAWSEDSIFPLILIQYIPPWWDPMRDTPMQRICSELTEKLLKSLDKEYNVSKGGVWCVAA